MTGLYAKVMALSGKEWEPDVWARNNQADTLKTALILKASKNIAMMYTFKVWIALVRYVAHPTYQVLPIQSLNQYRMRNTAASHLSQCLVLLLIF